MSYASVMENKIEGFSEIRTTLGFSTHGGGGRPYNCFPPCLAILRCVHGFKGYKTHAYVMFDTLYCTRKRIIAFAGFYA